MGDLQDIEKLEATRLPRLMSREIAVWVAREQLSLSCQPRRQPQRAGSFQSQKLSKPSSKLWVFGISASLKMNMPN